MHLVTYDCTLVQHYPSCMSIQIHGLSFNKSHCNFPCHIHHPSKIEGLQTFSAWVRLLSAKRQRESSRPPLTHAAAAPPPFLAVLPSATMAYAAVHCATAAPGAEEGAWCRSGGRRVHRPPPGTAASPRASKLVQELPKGCGHDNRLTLSHHLLLDLDLPVHHDIGEATRIL